MVRLILSGIAELLGLTAIIWGISLICIPAAIVIGGIVAIIIGLAIDPPARKGPK